MSVLPLETIHAITESVGVTLKDNVASALLADVEYRLREVIHEAKKFMRHSKRTVLKTEDINCALRLKNVEPLYGFTSTSAFRFKQVPQGIQRLYYLDDQEVDLDEIMFGPLPPVPLDITFTSHWLAIEGVQPAIVQNPTPAEAKSMLSESSHAYRSSASDPNFSGRNPGTLNGEPLVKHVLSKELQMYYDKITECILSPSEDLKNLAVESLGKDPGIQPLLPYFIQFATDKIIKSIRNLGILWSMMRITRAILDNPNLFVEPYLHQIIPNILTCIVSKKLGDTNDNHFALRAFSASLAAFPRITKTLLRAFLDPSKSLATHFGAIKGLAALGPEAVKVLLVPNLKSYSAVSLAGVRDAGGAFKSQEGSQVYLAILDVLKAHYHREREFDISLDVSESGPFSEAQLGMFFEDLKAYIGSLPRPPMPMAMHP
ncbi:Transcription initiation factor TFIID subunit 6 [Dinochytrium kinnereticum]|nr:Transcription initiation factor TFIID subunit 6 [Dinochytrium kinnereticum]